MKYNLWNKFLFLELYLRVTRSHLTVHRKLLVGTESEPSPSRYEVLIKHKHVGCEMSAIHKIRTFPLNRQKCLILDDLYLRVTSSRFTDRFKLLIWSESEPFPLPLLKSNKHNHAGGEMSVLPQILSFTVPL